MALRTLNGGQARHFAAAWAEALPKHIERIIGDAYNSSERDAALHVQHNLLPQIAAFQQRFEAELQRAFDPLDAFSSNQTFDYDHLATSTQDSHTEAQAAGDIGCALEHSTNAAAVQALRQAVLAHARGLQAAQVLRAVAPASLATALLRSLRACGVPLEGRLLLLRPLEQQGGKLWAEWFTALETLNAAHPEHLPVGSRWAPMAALSAAAEAHLRGLLSAEDDDAELARSMLTAVAEQTPAAVAIAAFHDWFDGLRADPLLPNLFQEELEALRFAAAKRALVEPEFFASADAALRQSMQQWCVAAALTSASYQSVAEVRSQLRRLSTEASPSAADVQQALLAAPLSTESRQQFAAATQQEALARAQAVLESVRDAAQGAVVNASMHPSVLQFAQIGIAPLLVAARLRDGCGSSAHRAAQQLQTRWQQSRRSTGHFSARMDLREDLRRAWRAAGADALWQETLDASLLAAWQAETQLVQASNDDPDAEIAALLAALDAPEPTPQKIFPLQTEAERRAEEATSAKMRPEVARLLCHGRWLRVPLAEGGARFLSVASIDVRAGSVQLATAAGEVVLQRAAESLLSELLSGRAELLGPDADAVALLDALKQETQKLLRAAA